MKKNALSPKETSPIAISKPADAEFLSVELQQILSMLRKKVGYNFSLYKPNTILRSIKKRMDSLQIEALPQYIYYLYQHPHETSILLKSLLIHVTHFFRDRDAFELLKHTLSTALLNHHSNTINKEFRVWVPGCSTGEEAYSIAMILRECMDALNLDVSVRIFATDIDPLAIETAREGVFPSHIETHVSPEKSYFQT